MTTPLAQAQDEQLFGGKAVQLGACLRAGLPVPPGFALSVPQVQALGRGDDALLEQMAGLVEPLGPVAVRSSAVGEDGAAASFAGQHATVLDVRGREQLRQAIGHVLASGQAAGAQAYRDRLGLVEPARMAIVVQQLVAADSAGVMFTRNPVSGADELVIEAAWGLGEVVVAGLVTPDRYRLARDGRVLERCAGDKDIALRSLPEGGTEEQAVAPHLLAALCLSDAELAALHQLAVRCEAHHGAGPHDIEFAFAAGRLYLLQRRAVTRAAPR